MRDRRQRSRIPTRAFSWVWLGVVPFFLFALLFLFLPSVSLFIGSFQDAKGNFTLANITGLFTPSILAAYWITIRISAFTAIGGGLFGFFLAYAGTLSGLPRWVRDGLMTFSGVASNFAGVPLAFAFIATLGRLGLVTVILRNLGIDLYDHGFNLYSFWGLSVTYMYFQFPLMVLIITPALEGLRREWREAAENLGATGLAILAPRGPTDPVALLVGLHDPPFWQCLRRLCHRHLLDGRADQPRHHPHRFADQRRRAA